jgi:hypothetical protein
MEDGDHSKCPVELLACPEHRNEQLRKMNEFGACESLPVERGVEGTGFRDKNSNPTIGFCLWCDKDFYSMEEVWEHNDDDMEACSEFQKYRGANRNQA